jgi:hypothetical protein
MAQERDEVVLQLEANGGKEKWWERKKEEEAQCFQQTF